MHNKLLLLAGSLMLLCFSGCSKDSAPDNEMPILATGGATSVSRNTAILSGSISVPEGSVVKNCGFLYSTVSTLPEADSEKVSITLKGTSDNYTAQLTGLVPNTKYYYCLYAASGYTTTRGNVREFTTAADGVPALEATSSISSTETSLTVASQLSDDGGSEVQKFGFAYKESGSSEAEKMVEVTRKETDGRFTFTVTGLTAETNYEIRAFATNAKGTGYGAKLTLATSAPEVPLLQLEAGKPGSTFVEVDAKLTNENDLSSGITEVGFCWSTEKETPTVDDNKGIAQLKGKAFGASIVSLQPGTKYYVRAYAVNKKTKTGYSNVVSFTTTKSSEPKLDATAASSADETSVVLQSRITDNGGHDVTKFGFAYRTEGGTETQKEVPASSLKEDGSFQFTLTGLLPATTYTIRAFAVNSTGTGYGASCTVATSAQQAPKVTVEIGTPGPASLPVAGVVQSAGGTSSVVREAGFCWSTNNNPTIADSKVTATLSGATFSATVIGLKAETKYYVRAYAVNEAKVGYSDAVEFTTAVSNVPGEDEIVSPDKKD